MDFGDFSENGRDMVGAYRLVHEIGAGGMGVVYLAEQETPVRREVAVKLIKAGMDTREVIRRFEAERHVLALMDHPGIAKVLDAGVSAHGRPFFVMELVEGVSLTEFCDRSRLNVHERVRLLVLACRGVQHAHQKGVIHRDLKPGNILAFRQEGKPVVKVIDFGIAKALTEDARGNTLWTHAGQVLGTPDYMSPEQARGDGSAMDTRTDVFALGAVLYELLTGLTPLQNKTRGAREGETPVIDHGADPPPPSSVYRGSDAPAASRGSTAMHLRRLLARDLDWITLRALAEDPDRRYPSAQALAADLENWLQGLPVAAAPDSAWYRISKYTRRNRGRVTAVILIGLTGIIGFVVSVMNAQRASRSEALALKHQARAEAQKQTAEEARIQADAAVEILLGALDNPHKHKSGLEVSVIEVLDQTAAKVRADSTLSPLKRSALLYSLGSIYEKHGRREPAANVVDESVRLRRIHLGLGHRLTLESEKFLGRSRRMLPQRSQNVALFERILKESRRSLGMTDALSMELLDELGVALYYAKDHVRAAEVQKENLDLCLGTLGPLHSRTLGAMDDLAANLLNLGRQEEAVKLMEKALEGLHRNPPTGSNGKLAVVCARLAHAYNDLDRHEEALALAGEAIEIGLLKFGPAHTQSAFFNQTKIRTLALMGRENEVLQACQDYLTSISHKEWTSDQKLTFDRVFKSYQEMLESLDMPSAAALMRDVRMKNGGELQVPAKGSPVTQEEMDPAGGDSGLNLLPDMATARVGSFGLGMLFEEVLALLAAADLKQVKLAGLAQRFQLTIPEWPGLNLGFREDGVLLEIQVEAGFPKLKLTALVADLSKARKLSGQTVENQERWQFPQGGCTAVITTDAMPSKEVLAILLKSPVWTPPGMPHSLTLAACREEAQKHDVQLVTD